MSDFLVLLAKVNLAMAAAILVVGLLRMPMRAAFHASVAYGLWLLVPAATLASLLPPRIVIAAAAQPVSVALPLVLPAGLPAAMAQAASFDWSLLLFIGWVAGMGAMMLFLAWQQRRFHRAENLGMAGPAVTGFWRPRIVVPATFAAQFNRSEQAAILAHEVAHLARQDVRINALVAGLRCLNWFNPLVHLGALWLRQDQELACDAAALEHVARVDYANALLKSQMRDLVLPLGCAWPSGEHPLTERVALLKRHLPGRARAMVGFAVIASLSLLAGVGAWAAQPARQIALSPASKGKPECPKSTGFCGKYFYAERAGGSGPAFFLTLESERQPDRVVMHFPYGMALADSAHMDFRSDRNLADHKTIIMSGNVRLTTDLDHMPGGGLHGERLVFDARTGMLDLDGKQIPSGMPNYVPCTKGCMQDGKPVK